VNICFCETVTPWIQSLECKYLPCDDVNVTVNVNVNRGFI